MTGAAGFSSLEDAIRRGTTDVSLDDPVHSRLLQASHDPTATALDVAVLMRQVLLAEKTRRGEGSEPLLPPPVRFEQQREVFQRAGLLPTTDARWRAEAWRPGWLMSPNDVASPDAAAAAARRRFFPDDTTVAGDPFLATLGRETYRSVGQRAATRAGLLTPAGRTTVIDLPTGEGKSLIFQAVDKIGFASDALEMQGQPGVTLVIVPTIALAYDHEAKCRRTPDEVLAYVGSGSEERRLRIVERLKSQQTGLVFAAPEAACQSLRGPLLDAARAGRFKAIVIDEAHLIDAWGTGFRTAFQSLSGLRAEVIAVSPAGRAPRTLLLSATLTPETLDTVQTLFAAPGQMQALHAGQVRPEPDYWVAPTADDTVRDAHVEEALDHLPRPLILYVTEVERAATWHARLLTTGYGRIASFHGRTPDTDRRETLAKWSAGEIDVVVATSAFGLGIDYPHVRSVIHACVPETFDRFYQEVGRGGRDGRAMVSLIAPTFKDFRTAAGLNRECVITVDRAFARWRAMFHHPDAQHLGGMRFRLRLDVAPGQSAEDIDMVGERSSQWNARVVTLLARSGLIRLSGDASDARPPTLGLFEVVEVLESGHLEKAVWQRRVEPFRQQIAAGRSRNLALMEDRLKETVCPCETVLDLYGSGHVDMACGSCRICRDNVQRRHPTTLRREPLSPWEAPDLDTSLSGLADQDLLVTYDPDDVGLAARRRAFAAVAGALQAGIRCVMRSGDMPPPFNRSLQDLATRAVFVARADHAATSRLPSGPLLVLVGPNGACRRSSQPILHPRITMLPAQYVDPDRPGEMLADRWLGPVMDLDAFSGRTSI